MKDAGTGDTLCDEKATIRFEGNTQSHLGMSFSLQPKANGKKKKLKHFAPEADEEDLAIRYSRDERPSNLFSR